MKDTKRILRKAVYNCLLDSVTIDSSIIPVFDEKRRIGVTTNLYILLSTQQESDDNTSDAFMTDSSIDIEVVHRTGFEVSKDTIDDISNQILTLLIPDPNADTGLPTYADPLWQITLVRRVSSITRNFSITDTESVVAGIVTIQAKIIQQNPAA